MAQKIGSTLTIKIGETKKSGRLEIKYLGIADEKKDKQQVDSISINEPDVYCFEIVDHEIKYEFKESSMISINGLVVKIIDEKVNDSSVTIRVLTREMVIRSFTEKFLDWELNHKKNKNQ